MASIKAQILKARLESEPELLVIDLRDAEDFARGAIPGAYHETFDEHLSARLAHRIGDRRRPIVFACAWGHRSAVASIALRREGFRDVSWLEGGLEAWGFAALPVSPGKPQEPFALEPERARSADA